MHAHFIIPVTRDWLENHPRNKLKKSTLPSSFSRLTFIRTTFLAASSAQSEKERERDAKIPRPEKPRALLLGKLFLPPPPLPLSLCLSRHHRVFRPRTLVIVPKERSNVSLLETTKRFPRRWRRLIVIFSLPWKIISKRAAVVVVSQFFCIGVRGTYAKRPTFSLFVTAASSSSSAVRAVVHHLWGVSAPPALGARARVGIVKTRMKGVMHTYIAAADVEVFDFTRFRGDIKSSVMSREGYIPTSGKLKFCGKLGRSFGNGKMKRRIFV